MTTIKQAIKFWCKYFYASEEVACCNEMTIDCMVKFANMIIETKKKNQISAIPVGKIKIV
jgi:hypothetical protein